MMKRKTFIKSLIALTLAPVAGVKALEGRPVKPPIEPIFYRNKELEAKLVQMKMDAERFFLLGRQSGKYYVPSVTSILDQHPARFLWSE